MELIKLLRLDGRMTTRDIARNLGISEVTARRRLKRLQEDGVIRIIAVLGPDHLNTSLHAVVSLKVNLRHVETIARQLADYPEIRFISITTGPHHIHMTLSVKDATELTSFLTHKVASLKGVTSADTSVSLKVVKSAYKWVASEDDPGLIE